jgi:hypothetical protein
VVLFDPLSVLAGAGPLGAILAYTLAELRDARKELVVLTKESAKANQDLAIAMNARAETDRSLRYSIDRLRDAFQLGHITGNPKQVADEISRGVNSDEDRR